MNDCGCCPQWTVVWLQYGCLVHVIDSMMDEITSLHQMFCQVKRRSIAQVEEAKCHLLVGVCSWYWLMSFRGRCGGCDARPPCSHEQTIHCEWVADFVSSDRVLRLLNKIWLSSPASHNVKLLATPPKTQKFLCAVATVVWGKPLSSGLWSCRERNGGGGRRAFRIPVGAQLVKTDTERLLSRWEADEF